MFRIAIAASGNGSNFENILIHSIENKLPFTKIVCLFTDKKDAFVIERAKKYQLPTHIILPNNFNNKIEYEIFFLNLLLQNNIDLLVLAGFMRIIGQTLLQALPKKIINIHPSYLPLYPGKSGVEDAFNVGAIESGVSVHYVNNIVDGGEIILQEKLFFTPEEDIVQWYKKIHTLEYKLYPQAIQKINPYL